MTGTCSRKIHLLSFACCKDAATGHASSDNSAVGAAVVIVSASERGVLSPSWRTCFVGLLSELSVVTILLGLSDSSAQGEVEDPEMSTSSTTLVTLLLKTVPDGVIKFTCEQS